MLSLHLPQAMSAWLSRLTARQAKPVRRVDQADTVMHWPPKPARVLASTERRIYKSLAKVMALEHPKGFLLAHVPLYKLVRVPQQHSYREWLSRTGLLTVDFALCDDQGRTRAIVMLPVPGGDERAVRRHDRLMRVLGATGLPITTWDPGWQSDDDESDVTEQLRALLFPRSLGNGYYEEVPQDA
jgi:hypothetical protein